MEELEDAVHDSPVGKTEGTFPEKSLARNRSLQGDLLPVPSSRGKVRRENRLTLEDAMRAEVRKGAAAEEIETRERCFISEVANDAGDESVSIARARVKAGGTTAWHRLRDVSERYIVVAGTGRVEVGGTGPVEVAAGDVVRIPPGTPQRIANTGTGDLVFYCVCAPPFRRDCYEALE
ncbi:MAG TPA: cupin domain-containing protein [Syntrophales bacterium]|nr:cupin domain-containing protein [Syntrophales bacterium]